MPRSRRHDSDSDDDSFYYQPVQVIETAHSGHRRSDAARGPTYVSGNLLAAPVHGGGRHRSASTGAKPQPQIVIDVNSSSKGSPSRSHSRHRRGRSRHGSDSESEEEIILRREHRRPRAKSHADRSPSPYGYSEYEYHKRMERLRDLEEKEREEEQEKRIKEHMEVEAAKKLMADQKRKKEEEEYKKKAIEDYHREELEKKLKKQKEEEEFNRQFEERVKREFTAAGYSEEHIESVLRRKKEKHTAKVMDLTRPTYIKVNRKYLSPDTLEVYELPWEWDEHDSNFIIIKKWISQDFQEDLFEHTRKLRERKLITSDSKATTELTVVNDKQRDKMYLVRKKSPNRRSWMFT